MDWSGNPALEEIAHHIVQYVDYLNGLNGVEAHIQGPHYDTTGQGRIPFIVLNVHDADVWVEGYFWHEGSLSLNALQLPATDLFNYSADFSEVSEIFPHLDRIVDLFKR